MFRLTFNADSGQRIKQLSKLPRANSAADRFWAGFSSLVDLITDSAVAAGEIKYRHKYVDLQTYLVVREYIAIQYAVNEEFCFVFIEKVSLSGHHPYPPDFEAILNQKPS